MTLRMYPWEIAHESDEAFAEFLVRPSELFKEFPERSRNVIAGILEVDVAKRAKWEEVINDEWVKAVSARIEKANVA